MKKDLPDERNFQKKLIRDLKDKYEDAIVLKIDASRSGVPQGFPDILILKDDKWAALECKKTKKATKRPNQEYRIERMNEMSFARFVYPENRKEVLDELQQALQS